MFILSKPLVIVSMAWLLFGVQLSADAFSTDPNPNAEMISTTTRIYIAAAGKPPTAANIRQSLKIENASGKQATEVMTALDLIGFGEVKGIDLVGAIIECMKRNPSNHVIQTAGIRALLVIDKEKGLELGLAMLRNVDIPLDDKLSLAYSLASLADDTHGYRLLREGLVSPHSFDRTLARSLFRSLIKLDGKPLPDEPEAKVDLKGLLKELKGKTKDPKILSELESLAKLIPPSTQPSKS